MKDRKEFLEKLFKEVRKHIPSQKECRVVTEEETEEIFDEKIDFSEFIDFLLDNEPLQLMLKEIPADLHWQIIMFFAMAGDNDDGFYEGMEQGKLWNMRDEETCDYLKFVKEQFGYKNGVDILYISVEEMLEYASDKQDL